MKDIYKIIRVSAWLLVLLTLLALISGFTPAKNFLFPSFLQFNYGLHIKFSIFGFLPLFYIHSLSGLILLITRHKNFNRQIYKIIIGIFWTLICLYLVYAYFAKINNSLSGSSLTNTMGNVEQNLNLNQNLVLTQSEVTKHSQTNDCWMIISGKVYNLSTYASSHPGGTNTIFSYCGQDGTNAYNTKNTGSPHSNYADQLLTNFYLGQLNQTVNTIQLEQVKQNIQNIPLSPKNDESEESDD